MKVCILSAGLGTRVGEVSNILHKALLPLGRQTVISKIIASFPKGTEFVVALGNKAEQIEAFLELAHPETKFHYAFVDPYQGPGSGPGYSLYCCKEFLQEPFLFTACDTLILEKYPAFDQNWIGVATVTDPENWCMAHLDSTNKNVKSLEYKVLGSKATWAFTGIACIHDYTKFWNNVAKSHNGGKEIQVNDGLRALVDGGLGVRELTWYDTGQWDSYQEVLGKFEKGLTFAGKTTDFTYHYDDRILKLYSDKDKANNFYNRALKLEGNIPKLLGKKGPVLAYSFLEGDLLSQRLNGPVSSHFLEWMEQNFWNRANIGQAEFRSATKQFYITKTVERLGKFYKKFGSEQLSSDSSLIINGLKCEAPTDLLKKLEAYIVDGGVPSVFHGDLHGDNVLVVNNQYFLIDWRESYAGLDYGDRYYDFAKYLHTLDFSVKSMEKGNYSVKHGPAGTHITHQVDSRTIDARDEFFRFLQKYDYNVERTEIINALTFLNMSPLYDRELSLYLYYLGCYKLMVAYQNYIRLS